MAKPPIILILLTILAMAVDTHAQQDRVLVMAHRGGNGLWPENTLLAFENAVGAGTDVLETDIWQTKDGVIVISHDGHVDRTTDGNGSIQDLTLEELKTFDAGYHWSQGDTYPHRGQGLTIPTLQEVFEVLPDITVNIDIKDNRPGIVEDLCHTLKAHKVEDRVIVASFHADILTDFRQRCPDVRTAANSREVLQFWLYTKIGLDRILGPTTHAFQVPRRFGPIRIVTPGFVSAAHRRGIEVHVWTVNDPEEMVELIEMGIDGIITDYPDRLYDVVGPRD
jgi:glycerophosphoryl diester phosphodiesterase